MRRTLNLFLAYVILVSLQGECLGEAKNLRTLTLKRRKYLGKSSLSLEESLLSFFWYYFLKSSVFLLPEECELGPLSIRHEALRYRVPFVGSPFLSFLLAF